MEDSIKRLRESYNIFAEEFAHTRKHKIWEEVISYLDHIKNTRLLDVGCGYSRYGKYFKGTYVGVDFSKKLIYLSLKDFPHLVYVVGDVLALPFKDRAFSHVLCSAVIHHLPSRELRLKALKELKRVSYKGVFISVWYYYQKRFEHLPKDVDLKWGGKHYRYYHLYDAEEFWEDVSKVFNNFIIFLDRDKNNLYCEVFMEDEDNGNS